MAGLLDSRSSVGAASQRGRARDDILFERVIKFVLPLKIHHVGHPGRTAISHHCRIGDALDHAVLAIAKNLDDSERASDREALAGSHYHCLDPIAASPAD